MKRTLLTLLTVLFMLPALADEGMWLPSLISSRIDDMRAKGFRLTAEDIYSVNQASMKDAVVLFNGGCTGELISPEGLLLTNHHCGYGAIQRHSTVEHDYLTDGFWAMSRAEELPNEKLWVRFLVRMEEVTDRIAAGETAEEIVKKAEAEAAAEKVRTQAEAAKSQAQQKLNAVTPGQRMIWPVRGKIKSDFAKNTFGLEIAGTQGDVVVAAMQGEVIWVGTLKGYSGTLAVVKHSPTLITAYGGLENVAVSQGSKIKSGQKLADLKGDTLRFEVRETGKCVDPLKYLNKR